MRMHCERAMGLDAYIFYHILHCRPIVDALYPYLLGMQVQVIHLTIPSHSVFAIFVMLEFVSRKPTINS